MTSEHPTPGQRPDAPRSTGAKLLAASDHLKRLLGWASLAYAHRALLKQGWTLLLAWLGAP